MHFSFREEGKIDSSIPSSSVSKVFSFLFLGLEGSKGKCKLCSLQEGFLQYCVMSFFPTEDHAEEKEVL